MSKNPAKVESGRKGGKATSKKYGSEYMSTIGKRGARTFHERYDLVPYALNDFLIVDRATRKPINTLSGRPIWDLSPSELGAADPHES